MIITLPAAGHAQEITAKQLEDGDSDFDGSFGFLAEGKWRLFVTADGSIMVMSLLESTMTGHLTNLSTRTYEMLAPSEQAAFRPVRVGKPGVTPSLPVPGLTPKSRPQPAEPARAGRPGPAANVGMSPDSSPKGS